jgi:hypothetical protein
MLPLPKKYNSNIYPLQRGYIDRVTDVKRTAENKFFIKTYNDFITVKSIKLEVFPSGKFIERKTVEQNYRPIQNMVYYYDCEGKEIIGKSTRTEKKIFDSLP